MPTFASESLLQGEIPEIRAFYGKSSPITCTELYSSFLGTLSPNTLPYFLKALELGSEQRQIPYTSLIHLLAVLKHGKPEMKAKLMFDMLENDNEVSQRGLAKFARIIGLSPKEIIAALGLLSEERAKEEEFVKLFLENQNAGIFTWFGDVGEPYRNVEEIRDNSKYAESIGLKTGELAEISEMQGVFDEYALCGEEIKQFQDSYLQLQTSHKLAAEDFSKLFARYGLKDPLLSRLVSELSGGGSVSRYSFIKIVGPLVKPSLRKQRNALLFDLMAERCLGDSAEDAEKLLSLSGLRDLLSSLSNPEESINRIMLELRQENVQRLNAIDFGLFADKHDPDLFTVLQNFCFMPYLELFFKPTLHLIERDCVFFLLDGTLDLSKYLEQHMREGRDEYCLLPADFWAAWLKFMESAKPGATGPSFDPTQLLAAAHTKKLAKNFLYPSQVVLAPERLYEAMARWHSKGYATTRVRRKVIKYVKGDEIPAPVGNYVVQAGDGTCCLEVEINKVFLYGMTVQDDGTFPTFPKYSFLEWITFRRKPVPEHVEISISRKKTLGDLAKRLKKRLATETVASTACRIYIEQTCIEEADYHTTIERYLLKKDPVQIAYIELQLPDGRWPTDEPAETEHYVRPLSCGLFNLGNTCYMNSALQCLYNTRFVKEYITEARFKSHVNLLNPLSKQGEVINSFASMVEEVWRSRKSAVSPSEFKATLGRFKDEFRLYSQQDSHEFLTFLIDCLHEDTNIIVNKGYYRHPEVKSEENELEDVANECWAIYLARNWSLFGFLFTGQLASQLTCKACHKTSWTFEPFMSISLPMSLCETTVLNVTVSLLPVKKRNHLLSHPGFDITSLEPLRNELPRLVTVTGQANETVADLVNRLYRMKGLPLVPQSPLTTLELCLVINTKVVQIFRAQEKLTVLEQYSKSLTEVWAFETLVERARVDKEFDCSLSGIEIANVTEVPAREIDKSTLYLGFPLSKAGGLGFNLSRPKEYFIHVLNRCIMPNQKLVWKKAEPKLCGHPMIVRFMEGRTGSQLYENIWELVTPYLRRKSRYLREDSLWWSPKCAMATGKRPFVLRVVNSAGRSCPRCPWRKQCLGCVIESGRGKVDIAPDEYIAIDWYLDVYTKDYIDTYDKELHSSVDEARKLATQPKSLYGFLDKFTAHEELEKRVCENCRVADQTKKRLTIFRAPPIFIVHLKRYEQNFNTKDNTLVDFPIEGLDLQKFIDSKATRYNGNTKYSLYAIINHYGVLSSGHYTAYVRVGTRWYCYDDSHYYEIMLTPEKLGNAYMLFYLRSDLEDKSLGEVYPSIEEKMLCKPVRTLDGTEGFIKEIVQRKGDAPKKYVVKYFNSEITATLEEKEIAWETQEERTKVLENAREKERKEAESRAIQASVKPTGDKCAIF